MSPVVLVAPAAFKGTLGPRQVAEALALGVRRAFPEAVVLECPVADGGNGLLDVVLPAGALRERLEVTGPIGDRVSAEIGWIDARPRSSKARQPAASRSWNRKIATRCARR